MCRNVEAGRWCPFADSCIFAHSQAELRRPQDRLTKPSAEQVSTLLQSSVEAHCAMSITLCGGLHCGFVLVVATLLVIVASDLVAVLTVVPFCLCSVLCNIYLDVGCLTCCRTHCHGRLLFALLFLGVIFVFPLL